MRARATAGIGVLAAVFAAVLAAACSPAAPPPAAGQPPFRPVANVHEVMDSIVIPSSQAIFDSVVYNNGELMQAPKTDDDWYALHMHALAVAEAGNLLMMAPRAVDTADWYAMAADLNTQAMKVAAAAQEKNLDNLLSSGGHLYDACTACHEKYIQAP